MIDPAAIRVTRFDSGLTLLTERIPTVRSASIGVWLRRGSRDEPADRTGVAHFVEHMLFKGTPARSARDIAFAIDAMGGQLDAFTSKEITSYWAQVLDEHLPAAFELLADLVQNPRLDADDTDRERDVILEEIAAAEDDSEDVLFERFLRRFYAGHSMGRPILGTRETVGAMVPEMLREYLDSVRAGDLVVSAAGNLEHRAVEDLVGGAFDAVRPGPAQRARARPTANAHVEVMHREQLEQVHLCLAVEAAPATDPDRYVVSLLNTLLGGGVSSRLFQSIREERGLAYGVYSSAAAYSDTGYLVVNAATRPRNVEVVVELILGELDRLRSVAPPEEEVERMKDHLKGGLMLGLENTFGRMANLARQEIAFGRNYGLDEILAGIDAVTPGDVRRVAERFFDTRTLSAGFIARPDVAEGLVDTFGDGVPVPWSPHPTSRPQSRAPDGGDSGEGGRGDSGHAIE